MKILFQGDSITDAGRDRSNMHDLGPGYPKFAAEFLKKAYPDKDFEFVNLGISGDRAESLVARWQKDCVEIDPDIVTILIGINDTWHNSGNDVNWMKNAYYESCYRSILTDIKEKTHAKIVMVEQFLLFNEAKNFFREDMWQKIEITRKLAREFADAYVPMDGLFAKASIEKEPAYWSADGVHPTQAGAELIGKYLSKAIGEIIG